MKTLIIAMLVTVLLAPVACLAATPEQTWIQTYREAVRLDQQGSWPEARRTAQLALTKANYSFGRNSLNASKSHILLADLYAKRGKFASAEMHYLKGVGIRDRLFGPNHVGTARPLTSLADLYAIQGKDDQARTCFSRAISTRQGPNDPGVAKAMAGLARLEARDGRLEGSIALLKETLVLCENAKKYSNELCPLGIRSLIGLAEAYMAQHEYLRAAKAYAKALGNLRLTKQLDNEKYYFLLSRMGDAHRGAGSSTLARHYYRRATAIYAKERGPVPIVMGTLYVPLRASAD